MCATDLKMSQAKRAFTDFRLRVEAVRDDFIEVHRRLQRNLRVVTSTDAAVVGVVRRDRTTRTALAADHHEQGRYGSVAPTRGRRSREVVAAVVGQRRGRQTFQERDRVAQARPPAVRRHARVLRIERRAARSIRRRTRSSSSVGHGSFRGTAAVAVPTLQTGLGQQLVADVPLVETVFPVRFGRVRSAASDRREPDRLARQKNDEKYRQSGGRRHREPISSWNRK